MGIFEIKNALKAFEEHDVNLFLFDGSILGNLIRPSPLEKRLPSEVKRKDKNQIFTSIRRRIKK